jgi:hypothetical protein
MAYSSQDIPFDIIPVDNNGIKLKQEIGTPSPVTVGNP